MKFTFTRALALTIIVVGLASGAEAQQAAPTGMPMSMPHKNRPCAMEHQSIISACKPDPCSQSCEDARQQMKACRAANNIPPPKPKPGVKKKPCHKTSGTPQGSGGAAPASP